MNLRKLAQGRECMVRLDECNHNTETVVLAHFRMIGISGMGLKPPDLIAAFACSNCHDLIDGRTKSDYDRDFLRLVHLEACVRTQAQLIKEGVIKW